jgi:hypothetical protein
MWQNIPVSQQADAIERGGSFYLDLDAKALALYPWQDGSTDVLYMQPVGLEYDGPMVETPYGWKVPLKNHIYGATFLQLVDLQSARVPDALENYLGNGVALIYSGMPVANIPQGEWIPKRIAFSGMVDDCSFTIQDPANFLPGSTYPDWVPYSIAIYHLDKRNSGGHHRYTTGKIAHPPRPIAIGWLNGEITGWAYGRYRQVGPYTFDKVFFRNAQFDADMTRRGIGNPQTISVSADLGYTAEPVLTAENFAAIVARGNGAFDGVGDVTLDSVVYWGDTGSTGLEVAGAIYDENATPEPVNLEGDTGNFTVGTITGKTKITIPASGSPGMVLSPGTDHCIALAIDADAFSWYDNVSPSLAYRFNTPYNFTTEVWSASPDIHTTYVDAHQIGLYAEYSLAVSAPVVTNTAVATTPIPKGDDIELSATITDGDNVTTAWEWYIGNSDPGEGSGTAGVMPGGSSPFSVDASIDSSSIGYGAWLIHVRGFSSDGWGATDSANFFVSYAAPTSVTATGADESVELTWAATDDADNYSVLWGTSLTGGDPVGGATIVVGNVLEYTHTGRTNGVRYFYKIKGEKGAISGTFSDPAVSAVAGVPVAPDTSGLNLGIGLEL